MDFTANTGVESNSTPAADYGGYTTANSRLVFTQILYDGGFSASEIERLSYSRLTRLYELQEISETIALETVRAYGDVLRHRDLVEAATDNYIEHRQVFLQVEERANAGVGRRVDVEQASGRLALAESNLLTELTNLHDVSARYQRIVGEKPAAALPRLPEGFRFTDLPPSPVLVLTEGLSRNPAINASLENVRALRQAIASRQSARKPRVDFRAFQTLGRNVGGLPGETRTAGAEAVLNFSLYDGGASKAQERQATFERDQARDLQEKICRDTRQTLAIAYSDVNSLQLQMKYRDDHRLTTERSREAYRQQFEIGQRSLLDLLDSQNEFFEATRSYINTRFNQIIAQARVLSGMGRLIDTLGVARADMPTPQDLGQDRLGVDPSELCPAETTIVDSIEKIKSELVMPARRSMPGAENTAPRSLENSASAESAIAGFKAVPSSQVESSPAPAAVALPVTPLLIAPSDQAPAADNRPPGGRAAAVRPSGPSAAPSPIASGSVRPSEDVNRSAWMSMAAVDAQKTQGEPRPGQDSAPPRDTATEEAATASAVAATTSSPTAGAAVQPSERRADVLAALRTWARAWSERDMQAYAAAYAPDFKGSARNREEWLKQRTARIVPRQRIEVELEDEVVSIEGDEARVHFRQHYRSDTLQDIERRSVRMQRIDGRWLITQESRR